jgi:acylphosphatase
MDATTENARVHAHITGLVQGVGYRFSTVRQAERLGVAGWVRNRPDGSVELLAEGPRQRLESLVEWCRQGPTPARVEAVETDWQPARGEFRSFGVR